jgi:hypothetical protein
MIGDYLPSPADPKISIAGRAAPSADIESGP